MQILSYNLNREDALVYFHLLSSTSRVFLKANYIAVTNIFLSKWDIPYEIMRDSDNFAKNSYNLKSKIVLVGNFRVGKTSLLNYLENNQFNENYI